MANETLTIQQDKAKVTVIGKCKPDEFIDSGMGFDLDDLIVLDPLDVNWDQDVDTDLPDEIRIISPPYKTEYKNDEAIDLDGIIVKAYKNGSVWEGVSGKYTDGIIPISELYFSPMIFKSGATENLVEVTVDGVTYRATKAAHYAWAQSRYYSNKWHDSTESGTFTTYDEAIIFATVGNSSGSPGIRAARINYAYKDPTGIGGDAGYWTRDSDGPLGPTHTESTITKSTSGTSKYTKDNKTVVRSGYYTEIGIGVLPNYIDTVKLLYSEIDFPYYESGIPMEVLWELVFNSHPATEDITLSWNRPEDNYVLSATFHVANYVGD